MEVYNIYEEMRRWFGLVPDFRSRWKLSTAKRPWAKSYDKNPKGFQAEAKRLNDKNLSLQPSIKQRPILP